MWNFRTCREMTSRHIVGQTQKWYVYLILVWFQNVPCVSLAIGSLSTHSSSHPVCLMNDGSRKAELGMSPAPCRWVDIDPGSIWQTHLRGAGKRMWGVVGSSCHGSSAQAPVWLAAGAGSGVSVGTALCCAYVFLLAILFLAVEGSCSVPWHF